MMDDHLLSSSSSISCSSLATASSLSRLSMLWSSSPLPDRGWQPFSRWCFSLSSLEID